MTKIYSTASNDVIITTFHAKKSNAVGENKIKEAILIQGRANVRDKKTLETPKFGVTDVNDSQMKILKENPAFKRKVEAGFITIGKEPTSKKDKSAQLLPDDPKVKSSKAIVKSNVEGDDE